MAKAPSNERFVVRLLPVGVGLYLLTYVGARDPRRPPRVQVNRKPGSTAGVHFLFGPDVENELLAPGQAVVVSCREPTDLMITTCAEGVAASDDVDLRFDRLGDTAVASFAPELGALKAARQAQAAEPLAPLGRAASRPNGGPRPVTSAFRRREDEHEALGADLEEDDERDEDLDEEEDASAEGSTHFALSGHVQAVGDTESGPDGWLGAARGRRWIEGFAAAWQETIPGLRLTYAVDVLGRGRSKTSLAGQYAGTRRQATPIVGVEFEMSGAQASSYELVVRASFLGEGVQEGSGRRVELMGPTGEEPLTGLWLDVQKVTTAAKGKAKPKPATPSGKSRLRVFRSQKT